MRKYKAVIFDFDGTLFPGNAWFELTSFLDSDPEKHIEIYQKYMNGQHDLESAKNQLLNMWLKSKKAYRDPIRHFFSNLTLRENAKQIINYLNKAEIETCLISSNVDLCMEVMANKLGIGNWYAESRLIFDDKGRLVDLVYTAEKYDTKLKYLLEYSQLLNILPSECLMVGDGENDVVLFKEAGGGLTIGDDVPNELKKLSTGHINNLLEVKKFL